MAGILDDMYKKLRMGSGNALGGRSSDPSFDKTYNSLLGPVSAGLPSLNAAPAAAPVQSSFVNTPYGSGSSNYAAPTGQTNTANSPLASAYESLWSQNPASMPTASTPSPMGAISRVPQPVGGAPSLMPAATSVPGGADRLASPSLTAARNSDFFSDGRGGPISTLQASGGLDRGGFEAEARQRVAQDDYERRINTLAARNIYQDVAGGGVGGGGGRSSRRGGGDDDRGSRRVYAAATPAMETIDTRTAKAANSLRKDRNLLEQQGRGLAAVGSIESQKSALTASEIDQRIKELEEMRRGM